MVSSITSAPYFSYLNQLQGIQDSSVTPTASSSAPSSNTASQTVASDEVSSLLGSSGFAPEVLSLLQENSAGSFDPITSLLGGTSTNDPLTSIYANLFASSEAASLQTAQTHATQIASETASAATTSPVQSLINNLTTASVAYNNTITQNAQNVINANSYKADGITSLVA